ncbi:MAG: hypothetical protein IJG16_02645 [Clostridia bacterium]|nr:hypothetical protein [Clostridia bacterium]
MSHFQRVKNIVSGIFMILFAVMILTMPKYSYPLIAAVVSVLMFVYGFRLLFYYFRMARHMVGGKSILCQAVIALDLALFTTTIAFMGEVVIIIYLLVIYAFTGFVDILRAHESLRMKASNWKVKLVTGRISVLVAVSLIGVGVVKGDLQIIIYGYCISLVYSAIVKIATAFKRTAIVYIQ